MGLTDNKRFAPFIYRNSGTGSSSGRNAFSNGARGINLSGGMDPCSERGNLLIKRPSGRFCLPTISDPQKGWWVPPSSELEGPEQVHPRGALQDERVPHGERSGETGRLVSKNRFERCLFPNPSTSLSPEVSPVHLEGKSVPVPVPSIRTLVCPPSVYESDETSSGLSQREGNQINNLFGLSIDYLQLSRDPVSSNQLNPGFVPDTRSDHQRDQISDDAYPGDCVLGFSSFISKNDHFSPSEKDEENQAGCSSSTAEAPSVDTGNGHLCGKDHGSQSSYQGGSSIPSPASSTDKQCNITEVQKAYYQRIALTTEARAELQWWAQEASALNQAPVAPQLPDTIIETDASLVGWGAQHQGCRTEGQWSTEEKQMHINALELLAVSLALKTFVKDKSHLNVLVRTDSMSAKAYIKHLGGTHSHQLNSLAVQMWK